MAAMTEKKLKSKYDALINDVSNKRLDVYDGRGKGVDVYICQKCGALILTRYKNLGVTPYMMKCKNCSVDTTNDMSTTDIQTVEHFNKLMELMDIDFRLKEE